MKPSTTFTLSYNGGPVPEFFLQERCCYSYEKVDSVRGCLQEHLQALRARMDALVSILATDDPERAEHLLLDPVSVAATEVSLRQRPERIAFDALMKDAFG